MVKIVINKCYGGFGLNDAALQVLADRLHVTVDAVQDMQYRDFLEFRTNPELVKLVEEMGANCWGAFAELKVVEIPDDVSWYIDEYDGIESINEQHRSWY